MIFHKVKLIGTAYSKYDKDIYLTPNEINMLEKDLKKAQSIIETQPSLLYTNNNMYDSNYVLYICNNIISDEMLVNIDICAMQSNSNNDVDNDLLIGAC